MTLAALDPWALFGVGAMAGAGALLLGVAAWRRLRRSPADVGAPPRGPLDAAGRQEERLQLAVAGSNDALFDYDHGSRVLVVSDVFRRWLGGSGGNDTRFLELPLQEVLSRIHADHADSVYGAFRACAERGQSFDVEFRLAKSGGGHLWLQARGRGVPTGHGYRVSGFVSDVSRRKVAERLVYDTVDRLGAVLDNIAEGIVTLDGDGRICSVNAAVQQMIGIPRDDLIGQPLGAYMSLAAPLPGWSKLADRLPREARMRRDDGAGFPAEFAVSTMEVRSDERFIVVLRDVTERRMAEDRLHAAIAESQAATRAKDEFLATMSHEIRTPMNGVLGMTQLLLDMDLDAEQRETAQLIRSSGESLLTIINDILDFARAGSGQMKVDALPFDLRQLVREVVELLGRQRSPVDLYVDYAPEVPARLVGDAGRVRQVLLNLVGNAVKFTRAGHVVVKVAVADAAGAAAADGPMELRISVEDTGPGIPEAAKSSLFEPFTQADASTTRRFGGTGLGLAISRRLVELMGGEIGVDSQDGQGARFYFTLRVAVAQRGAPPPPALSGRRLLLVDDNPCGRGILARGLEHAGARVTAAASASETLEQLERDRFDLALIDDQMPDMDGLLLSELIRIDPDMARMPIVLMCMAGNRGVDETTAVDRALVKPLMPDYLVQELAALLADPALPARHRPAPVALPPPPARAGRRAAAPATVAAGPADPADPAGPADPAARDGRRRLLLAEDNPVNQQVAVRMLEKFGCRIDVAANGAEAVAMWRQFPYELIFMDCQMPELDGLGAARRIRELEVDAGRLPIPIVAMTANAMDQDRAECLAAGMDDYLSKPVSQAELGAVLARWLDAPASAAAGHDN